MGSLIAFLEPLVGERLASPTVAAALQRLGFARKRRPGVHVAVEIKPAAPRRYSAEHRREPTASSLPSDRTDQEWATLEPLLPKKRDGRGRPSTHARRELMNAIFYIARTGCQWRAIPRCYPHWQAVWSLVRRLRNDDRFSEIYAKEREHWRALRGKSAGPNHAIVDSRSVKTTEKGSLADTMQARRPKAAGTIWQWTAMDLSPVRR